MALESRSTGDVNAAHAMRQVVAKDAGRVNGTKARQDHGGWRADEPIQKCAVSRHGEVREEGTLREMSWGERLKRTAYDVNEMLEVCALDRCARLSDGRGVGIDGKDAAAVSAGPRLPQQPGAASDVDGVARGKQIERSQAQLRGDVPHRPESVTGDLDELGKPRRWGSMVICASIPTGNQRARAVGPNTRFGSDGRRERAP